MKLTTFLLLLTVLQVFAEDSYSQTTELSLNVHNSSVADVLKNLEENSEFYFLYSPKMIDVERKVSIQVENEKMNKILKLLFRNSNVRYVIRNRQIVLSTRERLNSLKAAEEPVGVGGMVTDQDGDPVVGVTVLVKGTTNGTITGVDGTFSLSDVPEDGILVFSFVGMKTLEINVEGRSSLQVAMEESALDLDEVVVVGYGNMKRSDLTGSVSSIRSDELDDKVFSSVSSTLQGRASGVQVVEHSGEPGGGISVKIRGANSLLGSNEPLYVIDGIPISIGGSVQLDSYWEESNPLAHLNPGDIENIEILKDASATAIYGSRGSNGVILITTKQARAGKPKLNFSMRFSLQDPGEPYEMGSSLQYAEWQNERVRMSNPEKTDAELFADDAFPFDGDDATHPLPENVSVNTDFMDAILRQAYTQTYNISYSQSTENFNHYLAFNYDNQDGVIISSNFKRANLKYSNESKFSEKFELRSNFNLSYILNDRVQTSAKTGLSGVTFLSMRNNPNIPLYDENGELYAFDEVTGEHLGNPVAEAEGKTNIEKNKDFIGGLTGIYSITDHLKLNVRLSGTYRDHNLNLYNDKTTRQGYLDNGSAIMSSFTHANFNTEIFMNYFRKFNDHGLNFTAGVAGETYDTENEYYKVSDFTFDDLKYNNLTLGNIKDAATTNKTTSSLQSGFARLNYNYKEKYLVTFTARADGSSKFGDNNKWGYFPSAAVSWRLSQEDFIKNLNVFSNLKLRASYGSSGNQAIQPYQTLATYGIDFVGMDNDLTYSDTYPERIANKDLKWETTTTFNVGTDIGFFDNRLTFTFEYYNKQTKDLLMQRSLPRATGFSSATTNLGKLSNKGVEFEVLAYLVQGSKFNWTTRFNMGHNKSRVLDLGGLEYLEGGNLTVNIVSYPGHRLYEGEEMGLLYGYRAIGLIQVDDLVNYENGDFTIATDANGDPAFVPVGNDKVPGHWKFADLNEDGTINSDDREIIGNANPDFTFGWTNDFYYGPFSLSLFFTGSYGNDIINVTKLYFSSGWEGGNQTREWYDNAYTLENQHDDIEWPSGGSRFPSTAVVEDGSYIRLKNLTLGYDFPSSKINWIQQARVYFTATNLLTLTRYSGADPEVSAFASGASQIGAPGVDASTYPRAKVYSLGIDITF